MINPLRRILVAALLIGVLGISSIVPFIPKSVSAAPGYCGQGPGLFGRPFCYGYFDNRLVAQPGGNGKLISPNGIPDDLDTVREFIALTEGMLNSGDARQTTTAQFYIHTMLGDPAGSGRDVSGEVSRWETVMKHFGNISDIDGQGVSRGTSGTIEWRSPQYTCGDATAYYQWFNGANDIAPDLEPCQNWTGIIFRDNGNGEVYDIDRICGNVRRTTGPLPTSNPNFDITPSINTSVNGTGSSIAQVGDTVHFSFNLSNSGSTSSEGGTSCATYANTYAGAHNEAQSGASPGGAGGPPVWCPGDFPVWSGEVGSEDVVITSSGQTICRSLFVSPATYGGGARGYEACVVVANRPYMQVYGGDIAAGSSLETSPNTCTPTSDGSIATWNKGGASSYAGSGVQFAAFAVNSINEFSSAQNNTGGASAPIGLTFANSSGGWGGNFGAGSTPCIPDYFSKHPTTPAPGGATINVSSLGSNAYYASSARTLTNGNINPNQKTTLYVNGNVYINSDIKYVGSWNLNSLPLFELVVRGNIYISNNVTRLDGVYIAQKNGASGGTIYTCATAPNAAANIDGTLYNTCNKKLTVNGAFVANSVELLRTKGAITDATNGQGTDQDGGTTNAAEVFNFNPSVWLVTPPNGTGRVDNYDAITSLPPVL